MATREKKSIHINRWIVVLLLVAIGVAWFLVPPARPEVSLAGESLLGYDAANKPIPMVTLPIVGGIPLTNTLVTSLIVDIVVIILALVAGHGIRKDGAPARGLTGVFETIFETIYNLVENTVGKKWAKQVFPFVATIILLVLTANLLKLFPGMESIGRAEPSHGTEPGRRIVEIIPGLVGLTAKQVASGGYILVPFFRSPSTDLNFTVSLAIVAMVTVQFFGLKANGPTYISKFLNFGRFFKFYLKDMWVKSDLNIFDMIYPLVDIFVGFLEFISEFVKIISFSFRLLGSMFGGAVLVVIVGTLLPVSDFFLLFLELFFGVIQALVFGILTMVFIALAVQSHGKQNEGHGETQMAQT